MDEVAWVIERNGGGSFKPPLEYLCIQSPSFTSGNRGFFYWHTHHGYALRFSREQDARLTLAAIREMQSQLPYKETTEGLRPNDPTRVVEHMWMDGPKAIEGQT